MDLNAQIWKKDLKWEGERVLTLSIRRPEPSDKTRADRRVGRYYERLAEAWRARWETVVYPRACQALQQARSQSRVFVPWSASLDFCVTLERDTVLSLYLDAVEAGPAPRPMTVRSGDTWDLTTGTPLTLAPFLPRCTHPRRILAADLQRQAAERLAGGESLFFEDAPARVPAVFSPRRFYLTQAGPAAFFPMCSLGPAAEGIPEFPLFV